jgi:hypothetical protein
MAANVFTPAKVFTVAEANASLPLVRAITRDLVRASRELLDRRERVRLLLSGRRLASGNPYDDELAQIEEQLDRDAQRVQEYIAELQDLGVEVKSALDGLLDFPARLQGRLVFLCWKLGEDQVDHWHEIDRGYSSRKPLPPHHYTS